MMLLSGIIIIFFSLLRALSTILSTPAIYGNASSKYSSGVSLMIGGAHFQLLS